MRSFARLLRRGALGVVAVVLVLCALVPAQQWLLRWRVQRLQADILPLQLHPGTFADLQRLQRRWGAHGRYVGTCTADECKYVIALHDPGASLRSDSWPDPHPRRYAWYTWLGGREVLAIAGVRVTRNVLWGAGFELDTSTSQRGQPPTEELISMLRASPQLLEGALLHLDDPRLDRGFQVQAPGACSGCVLAQVYVTYQTPPETTHRLLRVNFSCVTQWRPCTTQSEIVPGAWPDRLEYTPARAGQPCPALEARAREAPNLVLARVAGIQVVGTRESGGIWLDVEVEEQLKRAPQLPAGSRQRLVAAPWLPDAAAVRKGQRYFFLFADSMEIERAVIDFGACSIVPWTPANEAAVRAGNALDLSRGEPFWGREMIPLP